MHFFAQIISSWNEWQARSVNRQIFSAAVVVMAMTMAVKILAAGKEVVVAYYFGTSPALDAFLVAFILPSFAINVLAGSLTTSLMPVYIQVRENESTKAARRLFASTMAIGLTFLFLATCLMAAGSRYFLPLIGSGFDKQTMELCQKLFYLLLPSIIINGLIMLYSTTLNAGKRFALAAVMPAFVAVCAVVFILLFRDKLGIYALAEGTIAGMILQVIILGRYLARMKLPVFPKWYGMDQYLRAVIGQYWPWVIGSFLMSSKNLIDTAMAASLEKGSVSALNYGNKVVAMILGLGCSALATAALPHISQLVATSKWDTLKHTVFKYMKIILFITLPLVIILFSFSNNIVKVLFERGNFTENDVKIVSDILAFYALQIPFYTLDMFGVRFLNAIQMNRFVLMISGVNLFINIVGNYILMRVLGVKGIALSTSLAYILSSFLIWHFIIRYFKLRSRIL